MTPISDSVRFSIMVNAFDCLVEAKRARETIRNQIINVLRRPAVIWDPAPLMASPFFDVSYPPRTVLAAEEIEALLKADEIATENLRIATEDYARSQIHDYTQS